MTDYFDKFQRLRVNTSGGVSPHKPCLLLAVIDLAEAGSLEDNEIRYRPEPEKGSDPISPKFPSDKHNSLIFTHIRFDGLPEFHLISIYLENFSVILFSKVSHLGEISGKG